jgi:hypothetical protein
VTARDRLVLPARHVEDAHVAAIDALVVHERQRPAIALGRVVGARDEDELRAREPVIERVPARAPRRRVDGDEAPATLVLLGEKDLAERRGGAPLEARIDARELDVTIVERELAHAAPRRLDAGAHEPPRRARPAPS